MAKRMVLMLLAVLVVIAGLGFVKYRQIDTAMKAFASFQPPPVAVTTISVKQERWPATLSAIGNVVAVQGVTVSADLPGIVTRITFESGQFARKGDILVELDTRQEQAQLAAAEAQRDLAQVNFKRLDGLVQDGVISQADFDKAQAEQRATEAQAKEIRATIERKTIRAPFSGRLGLRQVNLGQYLAAGDPIAPLQSVDPVYVNFGIPQEQESQVHVGSTVTIRAEEQTGVRFQGRVTAINSLLDQATRNVQVQATLSNSGNKLHPGMFARVELATGAASSVLTLPASSISYAPYGDSVFVVADLKDPAGKSYRGVRQQFVKVGASRGDQVAILSGLSSGEEVVTSGTFKLRNGAAVQINNKVQPENSLTPRPEDN